MSDVESQVHELFTQAIAMPQSEWHAFLNRQNLDPEVLARVKRLLDCHVKSSDFLSRPAVALFPDLAGTLGNAVAEFRIMKEIGRGGMGVVYLAEDTILKRTVALKVLPPQADNENEATDRFRKEALAVARLSHPGIVQIYRTGTERGYAFIAMEFVEGYTLRSDRIALRLEPANAKSARHEGVEPFRVQSVNPETRSEASRYQDKHYIMDCARVVSEVADALDHAHRQGVIHRDVKPSNILLDQMGHARLTDFGVARIASDHTQQGTGDITGSFPYMSPEQARVNAIDIDHRTDIFSLGVVLYELLTGSRPFEGATPQDIIKSLSECEPVSIRTRNRLVPVDLATICHTAIEKRPHNRYQTMAHMAADLRCFLNSAPILARPPSLARRIAIACKKRLGTAGAVAAVLAVLSLSLMIVYINHQQHLRDSAWLSVESDAPGCQVLLQSIDTQEFSVSESARSLGATPLNRVLLEPGQYRLTIVQNDVTRAECNVLLFGTGPNNAVVLHVIDARQSSASRTASNAQDSRWVAYLRTPQNLRGSPMHRIEAGTYPFGVSAENTLTRVVSLPAFDIDSYEVSNQDYGAFLQETGHPAPDSWSVLGSDPKLADHPVVDITYTDAEAFARWAGKRLPTVLEWEAAARGIEGARFPGMQQRWNGIDQSYAHYRQAQLNVANGIDAGNFAYRACARPVTEGLSAEVPGLCNFFGNVREITGSVSKSKDGLAIIIRGRAWTDDPDYYALDTPLSSHLSNASICNGFRCARSASMPKVVPQK